MKTRRTLAIGAVLSIAIGIGGCAAGYVEVSSSYGPGITFQGLGSRYAWTEKSPAQQKYPAGLSELIESRLAAGLAKKGFSPAGGDAPDFLIGYRVARREKADSSSNPHIEMTQEGSLVVEVFEPGTKKLIWRGVAKSRLEDSDTPDRRTAKVDEAVRLLMQKFPARLPPKAQKA